MREISVSLARMGLCQLPGVRRPGHHRYEPPLGSGARRPAARKAGEETIDVALLAGVRRLKAAAPRGRSLSRSIDKLVLQGEQLRWDDDALSALATLSAKLGQELPLRRARSRGVRYAGMAKWDGSHGVWLW